MSSKDSGQRPTRQESKLDATDRAAREIIDAEAKARNTKTDALRKARLAKSASDAKSGKTPKS